MSHTFLVYASIKLISVTFEMLSLSIIKYRERQDKNCNEQRMAR